jgi:hypothetical protein
MVLSERFRMLLHSFSACSHLHFCKLFFQISKFPLFHFFIKPNCLLAAGLQTESVLVVGLGISPLNGAGDCGISGISPMAVTYPFGPFKPRILHAVLC